LLTLPAPCLSVIPMTNTQALAVGTRVVDTVAMRVYGRSTVGTVVAINHGETPLQSYADVLWDNDPSELPETLVWIDELEVVA
jgi:phage tail protein X